MKKESKIVINDICEIAVMVALALILDKLKISLGSTGGSMNLSMVPLIFLSIRKSFWKSLLASSVIFAILSIIFDGYPFVCLPFDYVIAFSGYAFAGLFYRKLFKSEKKEKNLLFALLLSIPVVFLTRMVGHVLSSIVVYEYEFVASLIYNLPYVSFSLLFSYIALFALIKPAIYLNNKFPAK